MDSTTAKRVMDGLRSFERAVMADWKKSWTLVVVWSLLFSIIGNAGVGPLSLPARRAAAATTNLSDIVRVDAGQGFGIALMSNGRVLAWGDNTSGQLGDGTNDPSLLPQEVSGLGAGSGVIEISAGYNHALALKSDGSVYAWGINAFGQLGDGTTTTRSTPVLVSGLGPGSGVTKISAGFTHSLAVKSDGTVLCWGRNSLGACGTGDTANPKTTPVTVTGSATDIVEAYAGANYSLARKSDGTVIAWGNNSNGSLGDGTTSQRNAPVNVIGLESGSGVTSIAVPGLAGATSSFAVKSDGTVLGWGLNTSGQLGNGLTTNATSPQEVSGLGSGSGITKIGAGSAHTYALKSDGTVYAWGANSSGQLGDGTTTQSLTPIQIPSLGAGSNVTFVTGGDAHGYALKSDGTVLAWGNNSAGQLGNNAYYGTNVPTQTSGLGAGSTVTAVSAGNAHALALKSDGTVLAWGTNTNGQLGDGTTTQRITPVAVSGLTGVSAISAGQSHSLALKSDGTVWAWGSNANGQLGDSTTTQRDTPVQVIGDATDIVAVAAGAATSYAIKSDGTVLAWGSNGSGALGINSSTTTQIAYPVPVTGLGAGSGATAFADMQGTILLLKSDGTVMGWGLNSTGTQLIDGTNNNALVPIQISTLGSGSGVTKIAAGHFSGYALKSDGTLLAWGTNSAGQVGNGTTSSVLTPTQVSGLGSGSGVTKISSGGINATSAYALKSDGTVLAWGNNSSGQLGDGTTRQRTSPVQVSGLDSTSGVTNIDAGSTFTLALKSDGTVLAWGANNSGQLGDGTVYTSSLTPANVLGGSVSAGINFNVAPAVHLDQPNGGEVLYAGETKLILWGGQGSQVVSARLSLSTDGGDTYPDTIATSMSGSGYWLWEVPDVTTDKARIKVEFLSVEGNTYVSDVSDADFTIIGSAPATSGSTDGTGITGGEGSGTSTAAVEGADTSASGRDALTREAANLLLPPEAPVDALVKVEGDSTVYYIGLDAKRHPFVNAAAYLSWYPNFDGVEDVGLATIVGIPLGAPILAHPGTHWVKIVSDPRTYYVEPGYKLRWIKDEAAAFALGGPDWNRNIVDVDPSFFTLYSQGPDIDAATLKTDWPSGTTIDSTLNIQDARKLDGLRYYVTGGKKRAFASDAVFEANGFQTRFAWNHASATASLETLKALPSGPDIVGPEDALFSLMH